MRLGSALSQMETLPTAAAAAEVLVLRKVLPQLLAVTYPGLS